MNNQDLNTVLMCAFRYALGRQTYMPSLIAGVIEEHMDDLEDYHKEKMVKEIDEAGPQVCSDLDITWQTLRIKLLRG